MYTYTSKDSSVVSSTTVYKDVMGYITHISHSSFEYLLKVLRTF